MKVIGISGLARSGKNTFCDISQKILEKNKYRVKQYSFANSLKREVAPFLREMCKVDVWTQNTEIKTDIRDFLVWYGTTFWRKREPNKWIDHVHNEIQIQSNTIDVALISDARYPNEIKWIQDVLDGEVIHLRKYTYDALNDLCIYDNPPNEEERKNDPIVREMSNYKVDWEKSSTIDVLNDPKMNAIVLDALNRTKYFKHTSIGTLL